MYGFVFIADMRAAKRTVPGAGSLQHLREVTAYGFHSNSIGRLKVGKKRIAGYLRGAVLSFSSVLDTQMDRTVITLKNFKPRLCHWTMVRMHLVYTGLM